MGCQAPGRQLRRRSTRNQFTAAPSRAAALAAVAAYREAMRRFAELGNLATWYTHLTVDDITSMLATPEQQKKAQDWIMKARESANLREIDEGRGRAGPHCYRSHDSGCWTSSTRKSVAGAGAHGHVI